MGSDVLGVSPRRKVTNLFLSYRRMHYLHLTTIPNKHSTTCTPDTNSNQSYNKTTPQRRAQSAGTE